MEKRVRFQSRWLPYALIAAADRDHAGLLLLAGGPGALPVGVAPGRVRRATAVRRARQFPRALERRAVPGVVPGHRGVFARWWPGSACRFRWCSRSSPTAIVRGAHAYKTLLIWPYAVAPAVAACCGCSCSTRRSASSRTGCTALGVDWNLRSQRQPGADAGRHRRGVEADQLQLPVLPRGTAVDPEVADRGGSDRRRGSGEAFRHDRLPAAVADDVLPASSSTSSTRSSTRSGSSTRRRRGGPGPGDRASSSTRSTRTASRGSTSAVRRRSR